MLRAPALRFLGARGEAETLFKGRINKNVQFSAWVRQLALFIHHCIIGMHITEQIGSAMA